MMNPVMNKEHPVNTDFQFVALPREAFAPLFAQSDVALAQAGIRRLRVDAEPGYPCRVSLQDAKLGETVLLLSWPYHDVASPYRAAGPLFVRENAATATPAVNEIPAMLRHRLLSVRAYDTEGLMHEAEVLEGTALAEHIRRVFSNPHIAYLHIHHARQGCFACRVVRVA